MKRFISETVLPSVQQQKGFKSVRLLVDRKNGKIATLGLWETEAELYCKKPFFNNRNSG